ncbi:MAG: hypothetical protein JWO05_975 [Gemmatimonadetes bacterium]|nr:hypothetical protein [Gemmatimonadota bacterium]
MRARPLLFVLPVIAFALTTWLFGWWTVPLVAAQAAWPAGARWKASTLAWCAMGAWVLLLLWDAAGGRLGAVSQMVGGAIQVPGPVLMVVSVLFAGLLAWSAAAFVEGVTRRVTADPSLRSG